MSRRFDVVLTIHPPVPQPPKPIEINREVRQILFDSVSFFFPFFSSFFPFISLELVALNYNTIDNNIIIHHDQRSDGFTVYDVLLPKKNRSNIEVRDDLHYYLFSRPMYFVLLSRTWKITLVILLRCVSVKKLSNYIILLRPYHMGCGILYENIFDIYVLTRSNECQINIELCVQFYVFS